MEKKISIRQFQILKSGREYISRNKVPLAFIAPSFIGVLIFVLAPFADVLKRSLFTVTGGDFEGVRNYLNVFSNDAFKLAAGNTLKFAVVCIPTLVLFSLLLAMLLAGVRGGGDSVKAVFLLPLAIPAASMVLVWKLFFHDNGLINSLLENFNTAIPFMTSAAAFWVLTVSYLWKNIGYDMVLWMGGLSRIPTDIYEAAAIDGAGSFRRLFFITLPNLVGVSFMVIVLSLLNSFKVFREAYLVAGEYPHTSMYMLQHLFNNWFTALDIEKLSAGAVITAAVIFLLISAWMKLVGEGDD